jgi:LCP family protein required for cell wall assembly
VAGIAVVVAAVVLAANALNPVGRPHPGPAAAPTQSPLAQPRVNVLLLGSDAGPDRVGIRPDSIVIASIDTGTGATTLIDLPRNLQHVPFPAGTPMAARYPSGFACADQSCLLNGLWQFGATAARDVRNPAHGYYARYPNPGLRATIDGVEGVTGLRIDRYLLLDLRGFVALVDAVGGVEVDVRHRLPIAGHVGANGEPAGATGYLQPGRQHLNGYQALWFVRSRSDTGEADRMLRQRCMLVALARQLDPLTVLRSLPELLGALRDDVVTDLPLSRLDDWVTLLRRVHQADVTSLVLPAPAQPDFPRLRQQVRHAIEGGPGPSGTGRSQGGAQPAADRC